MSPKCKSFRMRSLVAALNRSTEVLCALCRKEFPLSVYTRHLQWCRQSSKGPLSRCPYNRRHRVTDDELKLHLVTCSSRHLFQAATSSRGGAEQVAMAPVAPTPAVAEVEPMEVDVDGGVQLDLNNNVVADRNNNVA